MDINKVSLGDSNVDTSFSSGSSFDDMVPVEEVLAILLMSPTRDEFIYFVKLNGSVNKSNEKHERWCRLLIACMTCAGCRGS